MGTLIDDDLSHCDEVPPNHIQVQRKKRYAQIAKNAFNPKRKLSKDPFCIAGSGEDNHERDGRIADRSTSGPRTARHAPFSRDDDLPDHGAPLSLPLRAVGNTASQRRVVR
jgi:hypothetical protein